MPFEHNTLDKIDALYDAGRDFVERPEIHGSAVESQFDVCTFDQWRRKVNDLLFSVGGCEDLSYQRFSKEVTRPTARDLEKGLRILASVRDEVACALRSPGTDASGKGARCGKMSASYL